MITNSYCLLEIESVILKGNLVFLEPFKVGSAKIFQITSTYLKGSHSHYNFCNKNQVLKARLHGNYLLPSKYDVKEEMLRRGARMRLKEDKDSQFS